MHRRVRYPEPPAQVGQGGFLFWVLEDRGQQLALLPRPEDGQELRGCRSFHKLKDIFRTVEVQVSGHWAGTVGVEGPAGVTLASYLGTVGFLDRLRGQPPRAEWRPDPTSRHQLRWWDGHRWTEEVANEGVTSTEIVDGRSGYAVTVTSGRLSELADDVDFHALPFDHRVRRDVDAYSEPDRFRRAFGQVTMPIDGLRVWEVAGEGHRQETLGLVAGPKCADGAWCERVAELRPEPDNPYDNNAVAVFIDGHHVGYLPRREATTHRRLIDRTIAVDGKATCAAVVNGGWLRAEEGSEGSYGVRLYFGYTTSRASADGLPARLPDEERIPYVITDEGHDHITVTGEELHQDVLTAALGDAWVGDHPFCLAQLSVGTDPKGRETVTVSLDGQLVGWLTQKMAARFRPAVEATAAQGRRLTAAATLEPSRRKGCESEIDLVLRVPRGWGVT